MQLNYFKPYLYYELDYTGVVPKRAHRWRPALVCCLKLATNSDLKNIETILGQNISVLVENFKYNEKRCNEFAQYMTEKKRKETERKTKLLLQNNQDHPTSKDIALHSDHGEILFKSQESSNPETAYFSSRSRETYTFFRTSNWNYQILIINPSILVLVAHIDTFSQELFLEGAHFPLVSLTEKIAQDKWPEIYEIERKLTAAHIESDTIPIFLGAEYVPGYAP